MAELVLVGRKDLILAAFALFKTPAEKLQAEKMTGTSLPTPSFTSNLSA